MSEEASASAPDQSEAGGSGKKTKRQKSMQDIRREKEAKLAAKN